VNWFTAQVRRTGGRVGRIVFTVVGPTAAALRLWQLLKDEASVNRFAEASKLTAVGSMPKEMALASVIFRSIGKQRKGPVLKESSVQAGFPEEIIAAMM